jgi:serine/threonine protein kinase
MLGRLIDHRYRIQSQLGAGGFGRTYLAQDTRRPGQPLCVVKQRRERISMMSGYHLGKLVAPFTWIGIAR